MKNRVLYILITVILFTLFAAPAFALDEYTARQFLQEINQARIEPLKFSRYLGNKPLPPLIWSVELTAAAEELIEEQGRSGTACHGCVTLYFLIHGKF